MPSNNTPDADERSKAIEAVNLRRSGLTYREISEQTGYWTDESGARHAVNRLLARHETEGVAELRAVECERLDALQRAVWAAAMTGDVDAVKAVLQVIDRRCRLLGLNAPQRVSVGPDDGVSATEFATRAAELITSLRPDVLRSALAEMPDGAAVLAAAERTPPPEGDCPSEPVAPGTGAVSPVSADEWSNVAGTTPPPVDFADLDLSGIPDAVLAAAEAAGDDDTAERMIRAYLAGVR